MTPGEDWAWVFKNHHHPRTQKLPAHLLAWHRRRLKRPVFPWALPVCQPHTACPCSSDTQLFFVPVAQMLMQLCWSQSDGTVRAGDRTPGGLKGNDRRRQGPHGFYVPFPASPSDQQMLRFYCSQQRLQISFVVSGMAAAAATPAPAAAVPSCFL